MPWALAHDRGSACPPPFERVALTGRHPMRVTQPTAQELRLALDVSECDEIDVELRVLALEGTSPTVDIEIQTGMQLDTDHGWVTLASFQQVGSAPAIQLRNLRGLLRYLRWKVTALSSGAAATFLIDGTARQWAPRARFDFGKPPLSERTGEDDVPPVVEQSQPFQWPAVLGVEPPTLGDFGLLGTAPCPIAWKPNIWRPVFYGIQDFHERGGAPMRIRVFYPSIDGSPWNAPLANCGKYPVILFAHGECGDKDYAPLVDWVPTCAILARSGYIVILPALEHGANPSTSSVPVQLLQAWWWLAENWVHRAAMDVANTGVAGHSWGGIGAARLAAEFPTGPWKACATLGSNWHDYGDDKAIETLFDNLTTTPKVIFATQYGLSETIAQYWGVVKAPRHHITFQSAAHWDFLIGPRSCAPDTGALLADCPAVGPMAADMLLTFFSKYMPPVPPLAEMLPTLFPWSGSDLYYSNPSPDQQFYFGGHLLGRNLFLASGCTAHIWYDTYFGSNPTSGQWVLS